MNPAHHHHQPRRKHRTRSSSSKLSFDTVQALPLYSASFSCTKSPHSEGNESDKPPDYPESEEADAETEEHPATVFVPQHFQPNSRRRAPLSTRRRKRQFVPVPPSDPFLDALLERSVHALETSNALLQSSISTHSSLSALLSPEGPDLSLEVRARNLSTRIRLNSGVHGTWTDHLDEISKDVDVLFDEQLTIKLDQPSISQSLPTSSTRHFRHRRKPSLLELNGSSSSSSQLQFSYPKRDVLVAPAPRALTQYVESTADPCTIILPSTLGLRPSASSPSPNCHDLLFTSLQELQFSHPLPSVSVRPVGLPTPAYILLSDIAKRSELAPPPPPPFSLALMSRRGSASTCSADRGLKSSMSPCSLPRKRSSPDLRRTPESPRSRSATPRRPLSPCARVLTPPIEELSAASSDSSELPTGYRTVQSLRKILDQQPSFTSVDSITRKGSEQMASPNFLPVTPPPAPISSTSTATASISRLFTKGRHSSSTRPPSPPTHSSMKVRSMPSTPPSSSTGRLSEEFGVAKVLGSKSSSGVLTPKRISFAELPESYAESRPGISKLHEKRKIRSRKRKGQDVEEESNWFQTLFYVGPLGAGSGRMEERVEERVARGWGSQPGYGMLDDWAV